METIIETRDLSKTFGGKRAVDGLNLVVPRGAIFALLGDNGAGKTTTIRMLTGLLQPDTGSARILGEDCWSAATRLRTQVAYVPERPKYYDWMTIAETGWFAAGFHDAEFLPRFEEWVNKFKLDPKSRLDQVSIFQNSWPADLQLALSPTRIVEQKFIEHMGLVPWESERQDRIVGAMTRGQLNRLQEPYWMISRIPQQSDFWTGIAF